MVKGLSKRVVVVKFSDTRLFEQAILLMRDGVDENGVTEQQVLQEAHAVAEQYQRERMCKRQPGMGVRLLCALGGAGAAGLAWLLTALLG